MKAVPGTYLTLAGNWRDKDTIETPHAVRLLAWIRSSTSPTSPASSTVRSCWRPKSRAADRLAPGDAECRRHRQVDRRRSRRPFVSASTTSGLKPFYETYGRYSVYLHVTLK